MRPRGASELVAGRELMLPRGASDCAVDGGLLERTEHDECMCIRASCRLTIAICVESAVRRATSAASSEPPQLDATLSTPAPLSTAAARPGGAGDARGHGAGETCVGTR